jgi:NADPH-dependent ferric siderophore reductase
MTRRGEQGGRGERGGHGKRAEDAPWLFFDLRVVRARRLGPTTLRVTFTGERLAGFASGGHDQRFKLFFPHPYQDAPIVPADAGEDWFARWRAMDPAVRAVMRTYTVREQRFGPDELDVDFALHGDLGPASRWAARARPGDRLTALGPTSTDNRGVDFRPPQGTDWVLITADETALPAAAGILRSLPRDLPARVWIEVAHPEDFQRLPSTAQADITWLVRRGAARDARLLLDMLGEVELPAGQPYAWLAGESGTVRALRRFLIGERGFDRGTVMSTGYWRHGASEDELIAAPDVNGVPDMNAVPDVNRVPDVNAASEPGAVTRSQVAAARP